MDKVTTTQAGNRRVWQDVRSVVRRKREKTLQERARWVDQVRSTPRVDALRRP